MILLISWSFIAFKVQKPMMHLKLSLVWKTCEQLTIGFICFDLATSLSIVVVVIIIIIIIIIIM